MKGKLLMYYSNQFNINHILNFPETKFKIQINLDDNRVIDFGYYLGHTQLTSILVNS